MHQADDASRQTSNQPRSNHFGRLIFGGIFSSVPNSNILSAQPHGGIPCAVCRDLSSRFAWKLNELPCQPSHLPTAASSPSICLPACEPFVAAVSSARA